MYFIYHLILYERARSQTFCGFNDAVSIVIVDIPFELLLILLEAGHVITDGQVPVTRTPGPGRLAARPRHHAPLHTPGEAVPGGGGAGGGGLGQLHMLDGLGKAEGSKNENLKKRINDLEIKLNIASFWF